MPYNKEYFLSFFIFYFLMGSYIIIFFTILNIDISYISYIYITNYIHLYQFNITKI